MFIKGALSSFWRVFEFYRQGFSAMRLGKTLWGLIFIKLFVIFVLLKIFVFDENLNSTFASNADKSEFVLRNLINPTNLGANSANSNTNSQEIQTLSHKNAAKIHKEQTNESKINTSNSKQKDTR